MSINPTSNVKITNLPNGLTVITENIPWVKSCSIGIFVQVGSVFEQKQEYGYSHFLEHMVFRGTEKRSAQDVYKTIEHVGGSINAFTSREYTCYYGKIISNDFRILLNILEELVFLPALPKREMKKEKQVVLQEIDSGREEPFEYITDVFIEKLWPGQVFGRNILGNKTSIQRLSHNNLHEFYRKHYTPKNIIIAASGNIRHSEFVDALAYACGNRNSGPRNDPTKILVDRSRIGKGTYFVKSDTDQYHIFYGFETFGRRDERRSILNVINLVLGGPLMTARLYTKMREFYGIAYDVNTYLSMVYDTGLFGVYAATNKGNVKKALKIIEEEIENIKQDALKDEELETILAQIKNSLVFEHESTGKRMIKMGRDIIYHGRVRDMDEILEEYNNIGKEDIKKVAEDIFGKAPLIIILGRDPREIMLK